MPLIKTYQLQLIKPINYNNALYIKLLHQLPMYMPLIDKVLLNKTKKIYHLQCQFRMCPWAFWLPNSSGGWEASVCLLSQLLYQSCRMDGMSLVSGLRWSPPSSGRWPGAVPTSIRSLKWIKHFLLGTLVTYGERDPKIEPVYTNKPEYSSLAQTWPSKTGKRVGKKEEGFLWGTLQSS